MKKHLCRGLTAFLLILCLDFLGNAMFPSLNPTFCDFAIGCRTAYAATPLTLTPVSLSLDKVGSKVNLYPDQSRIQGLSLTFDDPYLTGTLTIQVSGDTVTTGELIYATADNRNTFTIRSYRPSQDTSGNYVYELYLSNPGSIAAGEYHLREIQIGDSNYNITSYTNTNNSVMKSAPTIKVWSAAEVFASLKPGDEINLISGGLSAYGDGTPITIPAGVTVNLTQTDTFTVPSQGMILEGTMVANMELKNWDCITFGPQGLLKISKSISTYLFNMPDNFDHRQWMSHLAPVDPANAPTVTFRDYFETHTYTWNKARGRYETAEDVPPTDEIPVKDLIGSKLSVSAGSWDEAQWYAVQITKTGYYHVDYQYDNNKAFEDGMILEVYADPGNGFPEQVLKLENNEYREYPSDPVFTIDDLYMTVGTTIYVKVQNLGCGAGTLQMTRYTPAKTPFQNILDLDAATPKVIYDKVGGYYVNLEIPVLDTNAVRDLAFDLYPELASYDNINGNDAQIAFHYDGSVDTVKDGKLKLKSDTLSCSQLQSGIWDFRKGSINWVLGDLQACDYTEYGYMEYVSTLTSLPEVVRYDGLLILDQLHIQVETKRYTNGSILENAEGEAPAVVEIPAGAHYFYDLQLHDVQEYGYSVSATHCFMASSEDVNLRLYNNDGSKLLRDSYNDGSFTMDIEGGQYLLEVRNRSEAPQTLSICIDNEEAAVSRITLDQSKLSKGQFITATILYTNRYPMKTALLSLRHQSDNSYSTIPLATDEILEQKELAGGNRSITLRFYLPDDSRVTAGDVLLPYELTMVDQYGKRTYLNRVNGSQLPEGFDHSITIITQQTAIDEAIQTGYDYTKDGPLMHDCSMKNVTIPAGTTVQMSGTVTSSHLIVKGTLICDRLCMEPNRESGDPGYLYLSGKILTGNIDFSNVRYESTKGAEIRLTRPHYDDEGNYCQNLLVDASYTEEGANAVVAIYKDLKADVDGTALTIYIPMAGVLGEWYWDEKAQSWFNYYNPENSVPLACGISFDDQTFNYDGQKHSITVSSLHKRYRATYTYEKNGVILNGTAFSEPGIYKVTAHIEVPVGYDPIPDKVAYMTIKEANAIKPAATSIQSLSNGSDGITVKWETIGNATGYKLYRKTGTGSWKAIKTISGGGTASYIDTQATKNGTTYSYRIYTLIKANGTTYKSKASAAKPICYLSTPDKPTVKNNAAKAATVTWKKNKKATGYQIKYVTGSTKKTVKVKGTSTLTTTLTKLTKNKTYKIYVRSYVTQDGVTSYSKYSSAVSVKITK